MRTLLGRGIAAGSLVMALACGSTQGGSSANTAGGSSKSGNSSAASNVTSGGSASQPGSTGGGSSSGSVSGSGITAHGGSVASPGACALAKTLRGKDQCDFLIGMGNDTDPSYDHNKDGAFTLGVTMDLHYVYLWGLPTLGGWTDYNKNPSLVGLLAATADSHGVTPMFTLYQMNGDLSVTTDSTKMGLYWQGAKQMFQDIGTFGKPTVVHLEPDWWGFAMQQSPDGTGKVLVSPAGADCAGLPDSFIGMAQCLLKLGRTYAPKAIIGFHASAWGGSQAQVIQFFKTIHADEADIVVVETLDRDAGCFEAHTDPNCMRTDGPWYWDETNQTSPNFHDHLAWAKALHDGIGLPLLWWQVPFGVPSATPGGTSGHYRDNRVHYIFNHVDEFANAGGLGVAFGVGAGNQTTWATDGDEFKNAVTSYFATPLTLQ